jgi:hypothetical protein
MFDTLFSRPCAIRRHRSGFLATERTAYLAQLAAQGTPPTTMRIRAHYCLHVARALKNWPLNHQFTPAEIETMATAWAAQSVASGRASTPKNPQRMFRMTAVAFLRFSDRFPLTPTAAPGRYADRIEAFLKEQRQYRWQSDETCRVGRGQVVAFLSYLEEQGYDLERLDVGHVDVYFQHITHRLSRMTLRNVGTGLRAWFRFCEAQGWTHPGLADAILLPRIWSCPRRLRINISDLPLPPERGPSVGDPHLKLVFKTPSMPLGQYLSARQPPTHDRQPVLSPTPSTAGATAARGTSALLAASRHGQ